MLTEKQVIEIFDDLNHPLHFLWFAVGREYGVKAAQDSPESFAQRRADFLDLMERLLREGRLYLAKNGVLLTGSVEEITAAFRAAFPNSDADVDMGGAGTWFFTDACPGSAVWAVKGPSGDEQLEWT
ncbi:DUF596 domain-containing protein [Ralstonia mojiangensis]|uniref:DUF596 domain-containing protein n=1 Tax=Ralstonia mojiangensis TaxID=2953895 RepID=UPI0021B31416|nr:DUF596 domain-containing protein [Ralstonia mojiangensis]MCT7329107.1 DUF596 domain-containing protein [Ralstonia mojiangensis]MCT7329678.1 DUF596 domain-containing protein [Ralstonia mojiangensis]